MDRVARLWKNRDTLVLRDVVSGMTQTIVLPCSHLWAEAELEENIVAAEESFLDTVRDAQPGHKLTKTEQHDLGAVLKQISASKKARRLTGHGKYF
jgi:hypothetical protein